MGFHTYKPKSRKWTMVAFSYLLDMARVNSATIHGLNKGMDPCAVNSFDYIHELVNGLVKPHIQQRDLKRLRWSTKNKVELIIGKANLVPASANKEADATYVCPQLLVKVTVKEKIMSTARDLYANRVESIHVAHTCYKNVTIVWNKNQ